MRCDHLTPVIFRASGSKFRVMVRASAREIPHATASRHQRRKIAKRAACCLLCASIVESRNAHTAASPLPPCRSLTDRASAHLCPDTLHHRPKTLRSSRPSPTHSTTKSPIVLSSSPQPPANPNLHALQLLHTPAQQLLNLAPSSPLPCPSLLSQILISHHRSPPSLISPLTPHLPSAPPLNPLSEPQPKPHHQPPPPPKYSKTHIKPDTSLALRDEE